MVEKKKDKVPKDETIPTNIDGIATDVQERKFVPHPLRIRLDDLEYHADTGRYDSLKGGISIGPCRAINGYVYVGTLGTKVIDNITGASMSLGAYHTLCVDNQWQAGNTIVQPSRLDGGRCPADVIGSLQRGILNDKVDCAVLSNNSRISADEIVDIGQVTGMAMPALDMTVMKRGRTTGLTFGVIDTIDLTVNIDFGETLGKMTLTNQIGVRVDPTQSSKFSDHGDSGALVVNDSLQAIGLHVLSSEDGTYGVENSIRNILDALNVSIPITKLAERAITADKNPKEKEWMKDKEILKEMQGDKVKEGKDGKEHGKDQVKAEWKETQMDKAHPDTQQQQQQQFALQIKEQLKSEWKEHHKEGKEHGKAEWKEHHKEKEEKDYKDKDKDAEISKGTDYPYHIGIIKPHKDIKDDLEKEQSKDYKEHHKEGKEHGKDQVKAEWKETQMDKAHPDTQQQQQQQFALQIKEQLKSEWKEHHKEGKEHGKAEWKEHHKEKEEKDYKDKDKDAEITKVSEKGKDEIKSEKEHLKDLVKSEWKEHHKEGKEHGKDQVKAEWKETQMDKAHPDTTSSPLSHFIERDKRPDLGTAALRSEPDLASLSQRLKKQAEEAKQYKDYKDTEKYSET